MDRINAINAHGNVLHEIKDGKRFFKEASFNGSENIPRTPITVEFLNDIQEEILSVIEESSILPESGKPQLIESIKKIVNNKAQETDTSLTRIIEQKTEDVRQELHDEKRTLNASIKKTNAEIKEVEKRLNTQVQRINTTLSNTNTQLNTNSSNISETTKKIGAFQKDIEEEKKQRTSMEGTLKHLNDFQEHFSFQAIDEKSAHWNILATKGKGAICCLGNFIFTFLNLSFDALSEYKDYLYIEDCPLTFPNSWYGENISKNSSSFVLGSSGVLNGQRKTVKLERDRLRVSGTKKGKNHLQVILVSVLTKNSKEWKEE